MFLVAWRYLDLVAGGLVLLPVDADVGAAVPSHHVLVELLGHVQVSHADQVTAVLEREGGGRGRLGLSR